MFAHRHKLIRLPPNRVWRTYPGGRTLDRLAGATEPADTHLAEDWIASTTRAINRGREHLSEGVSQVLVGHDPTPRDFAALLASDPAYFIGAEHAKKYGAQPQLLVKFLDSGTRLHFQVHPTREFARRVLGAPSGKTEAYHILALREGGPGVPSRGQPGAERAAHPEPSGYIYVGFQRPPAPARFMGRDLDFAFTIFNLAPLVAGDLDTRGHCRPRRRRELGPGSWQDDFIGPAQADCFRVARTHCGGPVLKDENIFVIAIVTEGAVMAGVGGERHLLHTYEKLFLPAGIGPVHFTPVNGPAEILECLPPA